MEADQKKTILLQQEIRSDAHDQADLEDDDRVVIRDGTIESIKSPGRTAILVRLFHEPPGWLPLVILFFNQILFALMHVLVKPALSYIPPFALAMLRVALALPFLFLIAWKEESLPKITRHDTLYMMMLGIVGVALPQTLIFVGNMLCGPNIISIMQPAAPVYAAIFAAALRLEKLTYVKLGGILLAVMGALVVLRPDKMQFHDSVSVGILIMIVQTMSYAIFLVSLRIKLITHPYPFGLYAHATLWGLILITIIGVFSGRVQFDVAAVPTSAWCAVLYSGLVISFFAHACQSWAVARTSASLPALFSCLSPFMTGLLSYMLLHQTMGSASDLIGLTLNVTGLLAVIYSRAKLEGDHHNSHSSSSSSSSSNTSYVTPVICDETEESEISDEAERKPKADLARLFSSSSSDSIPSSSLAQQRNAVTVKKTDSLTSSSPRKPAPQGAS